MKGVFFFPPCPHLENVGLPLAVVARKGGIDWPADAPHVLDELWITRKNCLVVQFKKIFPLKMKKKINKKINDVSSALGHI